MPCYLYSEEFSEEETRGSKDLAFTPASFLDLVALSC
jgi:hypothetical protein